jgi:hypothetical protein
MEASAFGVGDRVYFDNAKDAWVYSGDSVDELLHVAQTCYDNGEPYLNLENGLREAPNKVTFEPTLARLVMAMAQLERAGQREFVYAAGFPQCQRGEARRFTTNYNYIVHFGLATKRPGERHKPIYSLTDAAREFAFGEGRVPTYILANGAERVGESSESVTRQQVFTPDELAVVETPNFWL